MASSPGWTKLVSGGRTVVGGRPANVVTMSTAKGARINLYFDASKNLLVAEEFEGKDSTRRYEYSDHRAINGVMQPFTMKMVLDGMAYEVIFDDIKQNAQIARSEFDFPNLSGAPLPDIPSLLKELQANEDKVEGLLDTYSYMQRSTSRKSKTIDAFTLVHPEDDPGGQEEATTAHEIWARVSELPDKQREAIMLVYAEDMNHAEAAVIMGCKEATVSWHIHEAKKTLRGLL